MSRTKHWIIAHACRRLAEEVEALEHGAANADAITVIGHLRAAACAMHSSEPPIDLGLEQLDELAHSILMAALEPEGSERLTFQPGPKHAITLRAAAGFVTTPDLITFLSSSRQTGVLVVATPVESFVLEFEAGDIVHAHSDGAPAGQRLGDVLVAQGAVTREQLDAALASDAPIRIGLRLWEAGQVTHGQLMAALAQQIRLQFARLFDLPPLQFTFWSGPPVRAQRKMRLPVTGLLLDSARVADERAQRS